jgi:hypothetical protein
MMSKGVQMMLAALGINLDPAEIETAYVQLRDGLPQGVQYVKLKFESIEGRLTTIEGRLDEVVKLLGTTGVVPVKGQQINGATDTIRITDAATLRHHIGPDDVDGPGGSAGTR